MKLILTIFGLLVTVCAQAQSDDQSNAPEISCQVLKYGVKGAPVPIQVKLTVSGAHHDSLIDDPGYLVGRLQLDGYQFEVQYSLSDKGLALDASTPNKEEAGTSFEDVKTPRDLHIGHTGVVVSEGQTLGPSYTLMCEGRK
jgi:hypothetical protein